MQEGGERFLGQRNAELEIELLHHEIDQVRETEVVNLTAAVRELTAMLRKS